MLDTLAKKFQTAFLVFIVALISVVFVLQFGGPQAEGCTTAQTTYAAKVAGETISEGDFRASWTLAGFNRYPTEVAKNADLKAITLNGLIERTLLAEEARDLGFEVTEDEVWTRLADRGTLYLSMGADAPPNLPSGEIPVPVKDRDGNFDKEAAENFIQYQLRRSVGEFAESQIDEMLAHRMREVIASTVEVSPREVWDAYVRERESARVKYVRFAPAYYRDTLEPTDQQLSAWMAENTEEVDRDYEANRHRYTGLEKQVRARHILIKADAEASDDVKQAARERAERLLAQIRGGGDFAALAREHSEDPGSARKGGDLGYNPRGRMVGPFDDAQFSLEPGQVSDVVETQFGYHIIRVDGVREGDVPEDEAKKEIALRLYREEKAAEMARAAADQALAALRGGETIDALNARLTGRPAPEPGSEDTAAEEEARDPLAPRVEETVGFGRTSNPIPGPFDSGPLVRKAFELTMEEPLPGEPIQLGQDWFVIQLVERIEATREDFTDEVQQRLARILREQKQQEAVRLFVHRLRRQAEQDGSIRINEALLRYGDEEPEAG